MRVIRTEYYIKQMESIKIVRPRGHIYWGEGNEKFSNRGVAFAWYRNPAPENQPDLPRLPDLFDGGNFNHNHLPLAIDIIIREERLRRRGGWAQILNDTTPIRHSEIVSFVMDQMVIVEQSPPTEVKFKDLVKGVNTPMLLGSYLGVEMAGNSPVLLFVFVPAGILVVGTALGVTEAIAGGLNKSISRLFDKVIDKEQ